MNAWRVASLRPPHLAAIVPWEGALDLYRDAGRHGGILSNTFARAWSSNVEKHAADAPRAAASAQSELIDERQRRNHPDVSRIQVPLLSAANWGGSGLHLRGNIEGFLQARPNDSESLRLQREPPHVVDTARGGSGTGSVHPHYRGDARHAHYFPPARRRSRLAVPQPTALPWAAVTSLYSFDSAVPGTVW